jgi:hypothetical protein
MRKSATSPIKNNITAADVLSAVKVAPDNIFAHNMYSAGAKNNAITIAIVTFLVLLTWFLLPNSSLKFVY